MEKPEEHLSNLAGEVRAYQELGRYLADECETRVPVGRFVSATGIYEWGCTPAVLRRHVAAGRVKTRHTSRKANARCLYSLGDYLRTTLRDGRFATGRIHNRCSGPAPAEHPDP